VTRWLSGAACLFALVLALVAAGCGSSDDATSSAADKPAAADSKDSASNEPIVLGAPVPLTGALQPWGKWDLQMAELAVEDINKAGGVLGRPLKFESADDKSDFAKNGAAKALETLAKGAKVLATACDSDWGAPAQTTAAGKGVPSISWCGAAPQFGEKGLGKLTSSAGISTPNEAAVPAEWGYGDQGWRNAYLLSDPSIAYNTTYCEYFKKAFEKLGGKVVGEDEFKQTDSSIASQLTRLKGASPKADVILICSVPPGGATAVRQIRAAGIATPLMLSNGMAGDHWLGSVPGLKDAYQSTYAAFDGSDPIAKVDELATRWKEKYGSGVPLPSVYGGYVAVELIAAAIEKAGSTDGAAVGEALAGTKDVPTVFGKLSFEPGYNISFQYPVAILKVNNGKVSFVTRERPKMNAVELLGQN
jgi:branched-chain amino acid transport system substrate-binding protein